jgi:hypothetical protein
MLSTGWGIAREEGVTALWKGRYYSTIIPYFSLFVFFHTVLLIRIRCLFDPWIRDG